MNGVRSTYMRKGYLLTALAAAVLLAASSGTAYAQSVGFVGTSGTVMEDAVTKADKDPKTNDPLVIEITSSLDDDDKSNAGDVTVKVSDTGVLEGVPAPNKKIIFDDDGKASFSVYPKAKTPKSWKDRTVTLTLKSDAAGVVPDPAIYTVTIDDTEDQPVASFKKTSISLTEDSFTRVVVNIGVGDDETAPDLNGEPGQVGIVVSPSDVLTITGVTVDEDTGKADIGKISDAAKDGITLEIMAKMDDAGFRDPMVTISFDEETLADEEGGSRGDIDAGAPLMVTVQSDEDTPTVTFSTTSVLIDEGGTNTVAILADTTQGDEVGSVDVEVSGEAMISLRQDDMLEANADGSYTVSLGENANTILTISADSDPALEDGMTSTATITLVSASDADIGDRDSVTVTVNGSTAVPALPLVGQLLLALFLMVGGARLYRRRQG